MRIWDGLMAGPGRAGKLGADDFTENFVKLLIYLLFMGHGDARGIVTGMPVERRPGLVILLLEHEFVFDSLPSDLEAFACPLPVNV